jgi:hypothetical protein
MKTKHFAGVAAALLLLLLIGAAIAIPGLKKTADLGVAYGARVTCSCRHVGGRTLGDCKKDFEVGMEQVRVAENALDKSVTASVPLLASATARFVEGSGCILD